MNFIRNVFSRGKKHEIQPKNVTKTLGNTSTSGNVSPVINLLSTVNIELTSDSSFESQNMSSESLSNTTFSEPNATKTTFEKVVDVNDVINNSGELQLRYQELSVDNFDYDDGDLNKSKDFDISTRIGLEHNTDIEDLLDANIIQKNCSQNNEDIKNYDEVLNIRYLETTEDDLKAEETEINKTTKCLEEFNEILKSFAENENNLLKEYIDINEFDNLGQYDSKDIHFVPNSSFNEVVKSNTNNAFINTNDKNLIKRKQIDDINQDLQAIKEQAVSTDVIKVDRINNENNMTTNISLGVNCAKEMAKTEVIDISDDEIEKILEEEDIKKILSNITPNIILENVEPVERYAIKQTVELIAISSDDEEEKGDKNKIVNSDSDCPGYHSSDFEFITESEAEMEGLIVNVNFNMKINKRYQKHKVYTRKRSKNIGNKNLKSGCSNNAIKKYILRSKQEKPTEDIDIAMDKHVNQMSKQNNKIINEKCQIPEQDTLIADYKSDEILKHSATNCNYDHPMTQKSNETAKGALMPNEINQIAKQGDIGECNNVSIDKLNNSNNLTANEENPVVKQMNPIVNPSNPIDNTINPIDNHINPMANPTNPIDNNKNSTAKQPNPSLKAYYMNLRHKFNMEERNRHRNNHIMPIGDAYYQLFQELSSPIPGFMENKSVIPSSFIMQYEGIGFDMRGVVRDLDEERLYQGEADENAKKILEMYPAENRKRRRRY